MATTFGVELNEHGFCQTKPTNAIETTRPGIFVSASLALPTHPGIVVVSAGGANALQRAPFLPPRRPVP